METFYNSKKPAPASTGNRPLYLPKDVTNPHDKNIEYTLNIVS